MSSALMLAAIWSAVWELLLRESMGTPASRRMVTIARVFFRVALCNAGSSPDRQYGSAPRLRRSRRSSSLP